MGRYHACETVSARNVHVIDEDAKRANERCKVNK